VLIDNKLLILISITVYIRCSITETMIRINNYVFWGPHSTGETPLKPSYMSDLSYGFERSDMYEGF
jgi:hypothetical protein